MGKRRKSREMALQALYQIDVTGDRMSDIVLPEKRSKSRDHDAVRLYANQLIRGTCSRKKEIDSLIEPACKNWQLDRLSVIDRNILRLAVFEMIFNVERVPAQVCIDEAIELAKTFSAPDAAPFINAVLDTIKRNVL